MNDNAKKWVEALRSDIYKQTRGRLRTTEKGEYSYCCLGVACELYKANCRDVGEDIDWNGDYFLGDEEELPLEVMSWLGLKEADGSYQPPPKVITCGEGDGHSLINDNDYFYMTFNQIADIIESEPEGLFSDE